MLKLKLQYFGHLVQRADSPEKDPDGGKDWRQEKGMREDKMTGWHDRLNGHEFELTLGDGEWQRSLVCCNTWGCKESDTTEPLNNNNNKRMKRQAINWRACVSRSVTSDSLPPHELYPARLLCSWNTPSKNTGVGCHSLLQGIFPT